jgi:hypothetical protein
MVNKQMRGRPALARGPTRACVTLTLKEEAGAAVSR